MDVLLTVFSASSATADALPELATVTPTGTGVPGCSVGASATLAPDCALALLVSTTFATSVFTTRTTPCPPPAVPTPIWVFDDVVCAWPAFAVAAPELALVAASGVTGATGA